MIKKHQQVFVVTGAAGGIGRALCEKILKEGHYVFALDIRISSLQAIEENIDAAEKIRYGYAALDVTDEKAFADVLDSAQQKFGRIDCLINNAGVMSSGAFLDTSMAVWRQVIDINLMGVIYGTKAAVDIMRQQGFGKIVNVASTAGVTPVLNATAYAASKFAVVGFTQALRAELTGSNISVHLVIPGLIDTEIFDRAIDEGALNSRVIIDKVPLAKWPASKAAHAIYQGIQQSEETIIFPLINRILLFLYRWFPKSMSRLILANMR